MPLDIQAIHKNRLRRQQDFLQSDYAHREIADRLLERLDYVRINPVHILVYGWQPEYACQCLQARYPKAVVESVQSLAQLDKVADESVQLVISNLALEWEDQPKEVLSGCHRVLAGEGLLHFTTLGPDTAKELRESFSTVDQYAHVHKQTDMHHIGDCLKALSYDNPVVDMEQITLAYDELSDLFQDIKNTAATNVDTNRRHGLMAPRAWQAMLAQYEACKVEDYYPLTLEIIYGHAWKVLRREVGVPVEKITVKQKD